MSEPVAPGSVSQNRSIMIVLSYLWLLALVPLLVEKEDREVQWHAKHGIVLMVAEIVLWIAIMIVTAIISMVSGALGCVVSLLTMGLWLGNPGRPRRRHRQGRQRQHVLSSPGSASTLRASDARHLRVTRRRGDSRRRVVISASCLMFRRPRLLAHPGARARARGLRARSRGGLRLPNGRPAPPWELCVCTSGPPHR